MNIRAFFALPIPERVARALADYADTLCEYDRGLDARWVDSDSYHLTLCFLGNITLEQVEALELKTREALAEVIDFMIPLDDLIYYEAGSSRSVIAATTSEPTPLESLHNKLVDVARECGIKVADRAFKPHVTLGVLPDGNRFEVPDHWPVLKEVTAADSVVLFQSREGERGSIYTPLFEFELSD